MINLRQLFQYLYRRPSLLEIAARELAEAEQELLKAESGKEWADSMIAYNLARVKRLKRYLANLDKEA